MDSANADQIAYWNDRAGQTWTALQPLIDAQIAPLGLAAMDALAPRLGERVLDIGCGCGDTTLALAGRVGPAGAVLGVDISAPMLAVARGRAAGMAQVAFREADAQTVPFRVPFDAAFSRFGVMFFADPVAAFGNIRAALRPGGRLGFVCWRKPADNPWMMVPMEAAAALLPPQEAPDPLLAGPYAFAEAARVRAILSEAGFSGIELRAHDAAVGGFALDQAMILALRVGPLGRLLQEAPEQRDAVVAAVRDALARRVTDGRVWLGAGVWIVTAST